MSNAFWADFGRFLSGLIPNQYRTCTELVPNMVRILCDILLSYKLLQALFCVF